MAGDELRVTRSVLLPASEFYLCEDWISIQIRENRNRSEFLGMREGPRDIQQKIGGPQNLFAPMIRHSKPLRLPDKPVRPLFAEAETIHDLGQIIHIERTVIGQAIG